MKRISVAILIAALAFSLNAEEKTGGGVNNICNNLLFGVSGMRVFGSLKDADGGRYALKQTAVDFHTQYSLVLHNNFVFNAGLYIGRNNVASNIGGVAEDGNLFSNIQRNDLGDPRLHFGVDAGAGYAFVNNEKFLVYANGLVGFDLVAANASDDDNSVKNTLVVCNVGVDMAFVYKITSRAGVMADIQCVGKFGTDYISIENKGVKVEESYAFVGFGIVPTLSLNLML